MINATHTKGPWLVRKNFNNRNALDIFGDNGQTIIGNALLINQESNARLIAAAPDMLAALEAVTACLRGFHAADDFGPLDDEAVNAALDIIAKAKGN